jgi:glycosyltransferase involved in cell wall biosynthesis
MRKGQNPAKYVNTVAKPARITVAVLNYIPFQSGFYAQTLDVLKVCLGSIWDNTTELPYDLMVFDNGSCQEAIDYLLEAHQQGKIQYLLLSEKNLGKGGAWNLIFEAAPGEVIAYSDNDVYFYQGWLSKSLQILETYSKVGMVTSRPFPTKPELYSNTVQWAQQSAEVSLEQGRLIPWDVFKAFDMSRGLTEQQARQAYETHQDVRLTYRGILAYAGASHWQFIAYKSALQQFLPFYMDKPMGQVLVLDQKMNDAGYLRLMTNDPLTQNMSNRLDWIHTPPVGGPTRSRDNSLRRKFLNVPPVKRMLLGLYDRIFRWYYDIQ